MASSISVPMYWLGVMTLSLTHGSAIDLDLGHRRQPGGVVDHHRAAPADERDLVLDRRRGGDQVEIELALEALLHDLHVQQAQEAAPEAGPQGDRRFRLEADRGIVQVQFVERVAQLRQVLAADRVDAREDERLGLFVAGQWRRCRSLGAGQRVADLAVAHAL